MKHLINLRNVIIILLACLTQVIAQDVSDIYEKDTDVTLDQSLTLNAKHPYIDQFLDQDDTYVKWLYFANVKNEQIAHANGDHTSNKSTDGNSDLVFTVTRNGETEYDTVRNSIHLLIGDEKEEKSWDIFGIRKALAKLSAKNSIKDLDIQGDLPKGVMTYIEISRKQLKCGIDIPRSNMPLTVKILTKGGNEITTLTESSYEEGWHHFNWKRGQFKKGKYILSITADDKTMTQKFKI